MSDQNIYDNPVFFDGYRTLRMRPSSANTLVEKPALFSLCPDFTGKAVLDLGCGYGENCRAFSERGASRVVGIDISEKMLEIAQRENDCGNVRFIRMSMSGLSGCGGRFDVVTSSLAVHYIENFDKLLSGIYGLLNDNGVFVFSQEHPLTTALKSEACWTRDERGNITHYNLSDYSDLGERRTVWFVDNVIKYHRTFSAILNALTGAGFVVERVLEPLPDEAVMERYPSYKKYLHKPDFLLVRARKGCAAGVK